MTDKDMNIPIKDGLTPEEALEQFRNKKSDKSSVASMFYGLLESAPEGVVKHMESQAGQIIAAGHNIGRAFAEAEKNPELKNSFMRELQKIAVKMRSEVYTPDKDKEEETPE